MSKSDRSNLVTSKMKRNKTKKSKTALGSVPVSIGRNAVKYGPVIPLYGLQYHLHEMLKKSCPIFIKFPSELHYFVANGALMLIIVRIFPYTKRETQSNTDPVFSRYGLCIAL